MAIRRLQLSLGPSGGVSQQLSDNDAQRDAYHLVLFLCFFAVSAIRSRRPLIWAALAASHDPTQQHVPADRHPHCASCGHVGNVMGYIHGLRRRLQCMIALSPDAT